MPPAKRHKKEQEEAKESDPEEGGAHAGHGAAAATAAAAAAASSGAAQAAKPVLYSYWRSSSAWRVRLALALKHIEYDYVAVNLLTGQHKSTEHDARNPMKQVPVLAIDGQVLTQSVAILEYLEERTPEPALLPKDRATRALVRKLVELVNSGIQPVQNMAVLNTVEKLGGDKAAYAREQIEAGLAAFEKELAHIPWRKPGDPYCIGASLSAADLFLVPQCYNALRYGVDLAKFPEINNINTKLAAHWAFVKAHPNSQPDSE
jgi:maleylacetoacetate isomerase